MAVLEVEDNGPGIPENNHARIWDPFFTTRLEGEGTGLGLSLVNHIVAEHAGEIAVESSSPTGVRFIVRLPMVSDGGAFETKVPDRAERALDLLVVGGDPSDQRFLQRFLRSRGHAVFAAADAERALRLAAQTTFDVVVLDLGVAEDAPRLMADLRLSTGCVAARFVIAAHNADAATHLVARVGPNDIVLLKPYDVEQLRRAVEVG
jgi:CheY-like chemotaxis protein